MRLSMRNDEEEGAILYTVVAFYEDHRRANFSPEDVVLIADDAFHGVSRTLEFLAARARELEVWKHPEGGDR